MTATKSTAKHVPLPRVTFEESDGTLVALYRRRRYRFLMSDGQTVDVDAIRDDSDLRGAVVNRFGPDAVIAGSADLGEVRP